ncbi:glycosyltransferase family 2 protein [Geomobilimonas luticola]|uniref:Glycosyltransferase family 2 protein n=1 Tax=Geomobilimonas luticola TaxID=1114878 RepID=A0ABS5SCC4_9BACT|nr:glycosyltransferase family 2 protein [Geomobilimonas luticola]MBT0653017.1 glycosyltransferase family 2 protein [Geomobilimonas luticola]
MNIYIIVVNYNGWQDTVECLESVFRSDYSKYRVIVCDNGSTDNSLQQIEAWAEGRLDFTGSASSNFNQFQFPPVKKPLNFALYTQETAELGGDRGNDAQLVLIRCGKNLGFAGGNNVGFRYALARDDMDYAWLLNNDTVVRPDALSRMVDRLKASPGAGMCGATLLHYHAPQKVQALGGALYCKWFALAWHLGRWRRWGNKVNREKVEHLTDYPVGASLMVSRRFLDDVGLMCEDYFLYFEEIDWVLRGKGRYKIVYAPESIVYHKVGASIGTSSNPAQKSEVCDYYNARNRILFTRRFYPEALPTVYLVLLGTVFSRLLLGQWKRAGMIFKIMLEGGA